MIKSVNISDLTVGMMITKVIEQSGPVKIRKVGMIRSIDMIKGLKEMGVTLVEVDEAQSIQIDGDDNADGAQEATTKTLTQRLMASDKQIADADRKLSQQFHRSLFLPAVEHMPSKWTLYGKPYALLLVVVALGGSLGYFASRALINYTSPNANVANVSQESSQETQVSQSNSITPNVNQQAPVVEESESLDDVKTQAEQSTQTPTSLINANEASTSAVATEPAQDKNKQALLPATNVSENKLNVLPKVAGIQLETGQQVLGYQANEEPQAPQLNDQQAPPKAMNTPVIESEYGNYSDAASVPNSPAQRRQEAASSALYRKIQQAAQDVDRQTNEPEQEDLTVIDVSDLPRIDQLPAALLTQMPAMSFSAHMYASNSKDRWVRVNSRRLSEGDYIEDDLMITRIESEKVVLRFKGKEFTMNALSDW